MDGNPGLRPQDATRLFNNHYHARAKWYAIGLALGLSSADLAELEHNHPRDCTRCFEGVITKWLRLEGERTESELSQAVNRFQAPQPAIHSVHTQISTAIIIIAAIVCGLVAIFACTPSNVDPFTTAVMALKNKYKWQPVVEFKLLPYATDMTFLNITLRNQSEQSMINTNIIDSWQFFNEVDLKYRTDYMQPTNASDNNKHKSLRIMISGHPGAGKTTLMRHLAKEWAKGRALQACEMLLLIHLDSLSTTRQKPQSLSQLLQISSLHGQFNNVEEVSKKIREKNGAGVCFLFDSIDRWPHKDNYVHDLFFDSALHFSLCISTARQIHTFRKQSNIMYVDVLGFNERDLNDYLHALTFDQQVISSIETLWDSDGDIKDLCKLPLHMVMLIHITNLNIKQTVSIHTKTQLYSAFMNVMIQHAHYSGHLSDWNTWSLKRSILLKEGSCHIMKPEATEPASEYELCTAFQHLHSAAFDMLIQKKDKFPEKSTINSNINKFGFVNVTKVESIHDEVMYTFHHQTFVEFFAAIHLLSLPQEDRLYLYIKEQQSESQVDHNLWLFFFGLIGEHYNEDDYPNIIRQFAMYHSEQEIEQFPPYCQKGRFLEYLKEIHWKGKHFSKLSSAGVVVNSTLFTPCGDKPDTSLNTLLYILDHDTDIHAINFNNIGKTKSDFGNLLTQQAILSVMNFHTLDVLQSHIKQLNLSCIVTKGIQHIQHVGLTIFQNISPSEVNGPAGLLNKTAVSTMNETVFSIINECHDNFTQENYSKLEAEFYQIMQLLSPRLFDLVVSDIEKIGALGLLNNMSENSVDTIMENILEVLVVNDTINDNIREVPVVNDTIMENILEVLVVNDTIASWLEIIIEDLQITTLNAPDVFSTYIHMTLKSQTDLHERKVNWRNANSIVYYNLSGNILSYLMWDYMDTTFQTICEPLLQQNSKPELELSMLFQYQESIFHKLKEFWESLKTLSSHLDTLHLNSIELSCDDYPKLITRLKGKKNIRYVFDLNIDLGMPQDVSDSCRKLMSSLNVLVSHNIELQKLTVIFPKGTYRGEFIPHHDQLQSMGLKHLTFHLPESLRESNCYKLIDEVRKFKKLVTLEIQGCPLSKPSNLTRLPHTLQELTLGRSSLTDEDVKAIVKLINSKYKLTSLSLPNNFITGSKLKLLVKALKAHRDFSLLDLSGNPIAVKSGLEALSNLSNLRELRLSNCNLGDEEIEVLVDTLESNSNLHSLNLSGNPFIGSEHGLEPLARLTNLHHLDLSGSQHRYGHCHIEFDEGCIEHHTLIKVLEKLTQLRFLNLCFKSDPPIYWSKEMASVISHLPHLQVFNAPCLQT